jgi:ABC-2 type transport system permease protein
MLAGLAGMFLLTFAIVLLVGRRSEISLSAMHCALFAVTSIANATVFVAFGAFASQIMPVRSRAVSLSVLALGVSFLLRAAADIAGSVHWLIYLSPLGWTELVHPLSDGARAMWLLPSALLALLLMGIALLLSYRRDLGGSLFSERSTVRPHLSLLRNAFLADVRLTRGVTVAWLGAIVAFGVFFGSLAKTAGQAFSSSSVVNRLGADIAHQAQVTGSRLFIGFIFFMVMTLVLLYVASAFSNIRETEAAGYGDNFFVRSVGRGTWLAGRLVIVSGVVIIACMAAAIGIWAAGTAQHAGLGIGELMKAGANALAPAALLIGIGTFIFGFAPRLISIVLYGYVAWAFLLQLVGTVLQLNHWLLDTSVLFHVTLAPSVAPNWTVVGICAALGSVLTLLGVWRFRYRDLAAD